jgi:DNA-directed RNA polymerase specialized sigma24 family protein
MKYKKSVLEAILAERLLGSTYKEISDKLKITILEVKKAVLYGEEPKRERKRRKTRENKDGNLDI